MVSGGNNTDIRDALPASLLEALGKDPLSQFHSYMWTNHEGKGQTAAAEIVLSPWSALKPEWEIDNSFTFFDASLLGAAKAYEVRAISPLWQKQHAALPVVRCGGHHAAARGCQQAQSRRVARSHRRLPGYGRE